MNGSPLVPSASKPRASIGFRCMAGAVGLALFAVVAFVANAVVNDTGWLYLPLVGAIAGLLWADDMQALVVHARHRDKHNEF